MSTLFTSTSPHPQQSHSASRRPYRSKRNRPCTLCRSRKISCRVADNDVSCTSCRKGSKHCSFVDEPRSRVRTDHPEINVQDLTRSRETIEISVVFNQDQALNWDTDGRISDHAFDYTALNNGDSIALSTFYGDTQGFISTPELPDSTIPWITVSGKPSLNPGLVRSGLSAPLDHIGAQSQSSVTQDVLNGISTAQQGDLSPQSLPPNSLPCTPSITDRPPRRAGVFGQNEAGDKQPLMQHRVGPNSIDQRSGFHSSYFGLSGECDPYLLRHVLYDEFDEKPFNRLWYRATEAVQSNDSQDLSPHLMRVPVQFMLVADELVEEVLKTGPIHNLGPTRSPDELELQNLVSDEHGRRLILLFMEYIFPALPVISRSQLAQSTMSVYSSRSEGSKAAAPTYLLAAIYASALHFGSYDDVLCVSSLYQKPSAEKLWTIVYQGLQSQIHSPTLDTLSASLLYLNKARIGVQNISVDTPFTWTFTASTVAIATSLGLHMDCVTWSIPDWEIRLRRRLWWITFSEEKWRSLLLGRPSIISRDQWSVSELTNQDFEMDQTYELEPQCLPPGELRLFVKSLCSSGDKPESRLLSQQMTGLALIADDVYTTLYTVRATQYLANDLTASINAVNPLRESLVLWHADLPTTLQSHKKSSSEVSAVPLVPNSVACLHFAYLTLEVLIYRALLRPLENLDFGDSIINCQDMRQDIEGFYTGTISNIEAQDGHWDLEGLFTSNGDPQASFLGKAQAIICAAEQCATVVTTFTAELMSWDFAGFWYSWCRIGWATTSSFLALLLVQSPSVEHATIAKSLMDKWRQILRHQSKSFKDMSLGMTRLDAMYWSDMRKLFRVNRHVDKVLSN